MEKWQDKALLEIKKKMRIVDGRNISAEDYPEKRDCYPKLYKYITEHNPDYNGKICALYGLRRTGKTVMMNQCIACLLYTSDAADEEDCVDLGGRRIIKKKKKNNDVEEH